MRVRMYADYTDPKCGMEYTEFNVTGKMLNAPFHIKRRAIFC